MLRTWARRARPARLGALLGRRAAASQAHAPGVDLSQAAVCVWGANTGVGKTLISAALVAAAVRGQVPVQYLKPVQTGYPADSDARLVTAATEAAAGRAAAAAFLRRSETLHAFTDPVSPHLAAAAEGRRVDDGEVVAAVAGALAAFAAELAPRAGAAGGRGLSLVETAGGVTSPGPSGTLQGDLLRPLALPGLLVGDPALGGISTTLSAYESLLLRGQPPAAVVCMDDGRLSNIAAVAHHLRHAAAHRLGEGLPVLALPLCKPPPGGGGGAGAAGGAVDAHLAAWLEASAPQFDELLALLLDHHERRLAWLAGAARGAAESVWWPFTQHAALPHGDVTVVDGRAGDSWLVYTEQRAAGRQQAGQQEQAGQAAAAAAAAAGAAGAALTPLVDGASSWWTQTSGSAALSTEVVRAVSCAAGRYMHVMWPQAAHAPGLELTRALLAGPLGAGWAARAFFSDDGSTAVEVALKMAFRKFSADAGTLQHERGPELQVLGLGGSYHGDTLGAMDCSGPSPFNGRRQSPWYTGRGLFLDPPCLALTGGAWRLAATPGWLADAERAAGRDAAALSWASRDEVFDLPARRGSRLACVYEGHIAAAAAAHEASTGAALGVLLLEPVLQGAGGMRLVDPLFQAAAVKVARARGLAVVYDEVFTGCWRLGAPTGGALLGAAPDVAVYGKLLTGGAAPLAVTLASAGVFAAFAGDSKADALLHGHSYTAYPVGCAAAACSLAILAGAGTNPNLCAPGAPGRCAAEAAGRPACGGPCGRVAALWAEADAAALSTHPRLSGVVALGSVLAVELRGAGSYAGGSAAAADVVAALRARGVAARPLGAVVYLVLPPTTPRDAAARLLGALVQTLDDPATWGAGAGCEAII
ncbi:BIO3-BIO1 [Scenedesmus sp. PABB004]|nr:BIO3-BIO1 [Scenedesmus sp. PABB004]